MSQGLEETSGATGPALSSESILATPEKLKNVNPTTVANLNEGKRSRESVGSQPSPTTTSQPLAKKADLQNSATKHRAQGAKKYSIR